MTKTEQQGRQIIAIEQTDPETLYVPYYDPGIVYGDWPYAGYPPYYFGYPGYIAGGVIAAGLAFGAGWALGRWASGGNYWGGGFNWNGNNININRPRVNPLAGGNWQHRPEHRHGVRYGNADVRDKFGNNIRGGAQDRIDFRGRAGNQVVRPGAGLVQALAQELEQELARELGQELEQARDLARDNFPPIAPTPDSGLRKGPVLVNCPLTARTPAKGLPTARVPASGLLNDQAPDNGRPGVAEVTAWEILGPAGASRHTPRAGARVSPGVAAEQSAQAAVAVFVAVAAAGAVAAVAGAVAAVAAPMSFSNTISFRSAISRTASITIASNTTAVTETTSASWRRRCWL